MEVNCRLPIPINFNCWKHHSGFIAEQISSVRYYSDIEKLNECLLRIGNSRMDLYLGKHSVEEIALQILEYLRQNRALSFKEFEGWFGKDDKDYQLVKIKDRSIWTLRLSESNEKYVHIHPGRYSPHTIRVKAATAKTVIMVLALHKIKAVSLIDTDSVNKVRKKYLNEPPLKTIAKASGLARLFALFQNILQ